MPHMLRFKNFSGRGELWAIKYVMWPKKPIFLKKSETNDIGKKLHGRLASLVIARSQENCSITDGFQLWIFVKKCF